MAPGGTFLNGLFRAAPNVRRPTCSLELSGSLRSSLELCGDLRSSPELFRALGSLVELRSPPGLRDGAVR
eukprot:4182418-Alexandrium_andersonii.AAC.1